MATTPKTQFEISKNGYVAFDAMSLRQLILNRLNEQQIFTDQNFIGSNLASVIDIIAYAYNTLIFYLNRTSTESMFTEAQLYENINRIVKLIDYNPVGFQTSTLSFICSASTLAEGLYTIPRYSYVLTNDIAYSFNEDITFTKQQSVTTEYLEELSRQKLMYQGLYQEYPLYTAAGEDNEVVILNTANELVDHFNIDVYVRPIKTEIWEPYTKTTNLYLENSTAKKYEIRLNGNYRYEIKFGNDINGGKLQSGDTIAIYYLGSQGTSGEIGPQALSVNKAKLIPYNTLQFSTIINDILNNQYRLIISNEGTYFSFDNIQNSTPVKEPETTEDIRQAAPSNYRTQYRLVNSKDYETFVSTNFANLIADVKAINNWEYVSTYLKYYYDIGIQDPQKTDRALLNQVLYADACNFNNVYLIIVPRAGAQNFNYLVPAQKEVINTSILTNKMTTTETVFIDPVYKAFNIGIPNIQLEGDAELMFEDTQTQLEIIKKVSSRRDNQSIINDVVNIFNTYFSRKTVKLGQTVDVRSITQQILNVEGVHTFNTVNEDVKVEGLSFFVWNPLYPNSDNMTTSNNVVLNVFEYPYFANLTTLPQRIKVTTTATVYETIEY